MEKDPKQLKVRYSIETFEKLLVNQEVMRKRFEEVLKSNEETRLRLITLEKDRMNEDSRDKVA